ncbi:MAG: PilZ domain-containing protein [Candidatus Omnitrophica bacterium]|nr:PilZ domain-containing protein [Candidatus Omnitrophota bacterium]
MQETEFEDRRIFQRIPARLPLRFLTGHLSKEGLAQIQDISANGICLLTGEELQRYTPLEMRLQIPDKDEPLYVRGEVVWSERIEPNRYRAGVRLEKVDLVDLMELWRVLRAV